MSASNAALFFGVHPHRVQPGIWRVACRLCGVTGREHVPKIGPNGGRKEIGKEVREHALWHVEQAMEEHRDRCLAQQEPS